MRFKGDTMRERPKSLMIDIDGALRLRIKQAALDEQISMKDWITLAILEKLNGKKDVPE
jgi:predicted HicB family RNase H-like nuclease